MSAGPSRPRGFSITRTPMAEGATCLANISRPSSGGAAMRAGGAAHLFDGRGARHRRHGPRQAGGAVAGQGFQESEKGAFLIRGEPQRADVFGPAWSVDAAFVIVLDH